MVRDNILNNQEENKMVEDRCTRLGEEIRDFVLSNLCFWLKLSRTSEVLHADEACMHKSEVLSEVVSSAQHTKNVSILAI